MIGTVEALKLRINGGCAPAGNWRRAICDTAVICALAMSRLAFGCRKTLMMRLTIDRRRFDVLDVVDDRRENAFEDRS